MVKYVQKKHIEMGAMNARNNYEKKMKQYMKYKHQEGI